MGGMIPYFEGRVGPGWDQLGTRTSDVDYTLLLKKLKKRPLDYFRMFYADTALFGARAATELRAELLRRRPCAVRVRRAVRPREGIGLHAHGRSRSSTALDITPAQRHAIYEGNARGC